MDALDVLEQLEQTPGSNDKIAILKANKDNKELIELLDAALCFKYKFYVKKFDTTMGTGKGATHALFMRLLNSLSKRELTGNTALEAISSLMYFCNAAQLKWYARVLRKDLRCNFGISSCTKAGINIHEFDVMLAKDGKDTKNLQKIVSDGVYVSPKLDGYRCIAECSYGEVRLFSRNGSSYENFPTIVAALEPLCQDSMFYLDGEIMSDDFNSMQQTAFSSKSNKSVGDVKYHVFGWIAADEFDSGVFKAPTKLRLDNLKEFFKLNPTLTNIVKVDQTLVYKVEDILSLETTYMATGYEGAMALPNIPYYLGKKTGRLMKFKTMLSQDCVVVGMYEGEGKHEGRLGGLKLTQENGVACDVGSGFTDEDREIIWKDPSCAVGRIAEIKFQELTPDGVMRFPVFVRWRDKGAGSGKR